MSNKTRGILTIILIIFCAVNPLSAQRIKVITYNIHHCNPPAQKGVIDTDSIACVLRSSGAEIALLQEVDYKSNRVGGMDQPLELSQKSGMPYYRFFKAINIPGGEYGIMILSKYPISSSRSYMLAAIEDGEQRVVGIIEVKISDNETITVACTHLDLPDKIRELQVRQLDSLLMPVETPLILGGDFNSSPDSPEIKFMLNKFKSSTDKFNKTYPNLNPNVCIDYIFTNRNIGVKFLSHKVLDNVNSSDHLPVVVEFKMKK